MPLKEISERQEQWDIKKLQNGKSKGIIGNWIKYFKE